MVYTSLPQIPELPAGLYVLCPEQPLAFPLKHTAVKAKVSGNISRVEVTHTFENPFTTILEATYVFPLPDEAAVDTMVIRFCDRTIQGRIEQREAAQAIYERAKQQGQTAGLLEQERANIFTQSLANILPGEEIEVMLSYSDQLAYKQGSYEFVFPMVVGPRYIPGHPMAESETHRGSAPAPMMLNQDTDLVPDASRLNAPILPPGMRSGHDIQVTVDIETGGHSSNLISNLISNLQSPSHQIVVDTQETLTRITLAPSDTVPNKDLILRYQIAGDTTHTSLLTQADQRGGHFAVYLIPALSYDTTAYIPKDMVFLIDTSGSQSGAPLAQCQALMRRFITALHPQDTFNIVNFANTTQQLAKVSLPNTPHHRQQALTYVDRLRAGGGTEMMRGFKTVLNLPQLDPERIRNIVLLTDGYIGNETQIFAEVQRSLTPSSRLHSFGAGSSVNRFLLNRVAELGRGISHVVRHDQAIDQVVDRFLNQINNPVLGNLSLHWEGPGTAPSCYPLALPDLFAEQPLILFGHKPDQQPGTLRITGIAAGGQPFEQSFAVGFEPAGNPAIAQLWGRARIKALMNQMVNGETTQGVEAVTATALAYQLLSQYTAFVAVSDDVRVEQPHDAVAVQVPVLMSEAMSYEGVFGAAVSAPLSRSVPTRTRMEMPTAKKSAAARLGGLFQRHSAPQSESLEVGQAFAPAPHDMGSAPWPGTTGDSFAEVAAEELDLPLGASVPLEDEELSDTTLLESAVEGNRVVRGSSQPLKSHQLLQILEADGLEDPVLEQLKQYLADLTLINPQSGNLVFELVIQQGRVKRVMLDEAASAPQNPEVIEKIRCRLLTWHCPQTLTAPLRLALRLQP
ncbi:VIT domain-containing protein [Leptothoe sp. PORK10 BA2]|uniref:VIT domain-containing protein n=1 Tax=Leptothoe sp. PORK10 BA2 TaxID=3110254 RepID=UPI002B21E2D4|nr:VIT domain-containing protein [Leptothoe sp. PORK10 BA2]MEA5465688.1 VIT domain-containing protein [Leptothoe sp. PORK10 BA2]